MKLRTKALFVLMAVSVSGLTSIESALTAESIWGFRNANVAKARLYG